MKKKEEPGITRSSCQIVHVVTKDWFKIVQIISKIQINWGFDNQKRYRKHVKKLDETSRVTQQFKLFELSLEHVEILREQGIPFFLYKDGEKYYGTKIPKELDIHHPRANICSVWMQECRHLNKECNYYNYTKYQRCKYYIGGIEKTPDIVEGYETINTKYDCLFVIQCNRYCNHR